jgi:ribulose kinase
MRDAVIGIDVGTGSARAGIFSTAGETLGRASRPIATWRPQPDFVQQSSADIWAAVAASVREALAEADAVRIRGIGFDATCSLVVLDQVGAPVSIDPAGAPGQDVIVWMDHRAQDEAAEINASGHPVLRYVGGRISPEMETPKLLWLKRHLSTAWATAGHFFDLPDFLTWRATGALSRSLCSTVCKWTYLGHERRWDEGYFREIGLEDLADEGFRRIGTEILPLGSAVRGGLSAEAAAEFGLPPGIPVATSAIDAHAGGLGVIGAGEDGAPDFSRRLALIGGTSSCHMVVAPEPHAAYPALLDEARGAGATIYQGLNARLGALAVGREVPADLTEDLHILPDFHGNRSPRADAQLRGMISGLALSAGPDDLARLYLATIQAVAYGTRHIVETLNVGGYRIDTIIATGGGTKNPVFLQEHADATGCRIVLPREGEAVLLGAAILGAVAGRVFADIAGAMAAMTAVGEVVMPVGGPTAAYHALKYAVFQRLYQDQIAYRALMRGDA